MDLVDLVASMSFRDGFLFLTDVYGDVAFGGGNSDPVAIAIVFRLFKIVDVSQSSGVINIFLRYTVWFSCVCNNFTVYIICVFSHVNFGCSWVVLPWRG